MRPAVIQRRQILQGINTDRITILVYVVSALLSALAGIIFFIAVDLCFPDAGTNTAFDVVTAVLLAVRALPEGRGIFRAPSSAY